MMIVLLSLVHISNAAEVPLNSRGHATNPVWSIDGKRLAYEINDYAGQIDLYTIEMSGENPQGSANLVKLNIATSSFGGPTGVVAGDPIWHPQQKGMLFFEASYTGSKTRIYMTRLSSPPRQLIEEATVGGDLSWGTLTPDGNSLLFTSDISGGGDIYKFEIRGQQVVQLTSSDDSEMAPQMHPDGRLTYSHKNSGGEDIYILSDGNSQLIAGGDGDQTRPVWVNNEVVYFSNEQGGDTWDLRKVNSEGQMKKLAAEIRLPFRSSPSISSDKKWVAYGSVNPEKSDKIWFSRVDGSKTVFYDTGLVACGEPSLIESDGRVLVAFTALPAEGSDWRKLHVRDVTDRLR